MDTPARIAKAPKIRTKNKPAANGAKSSRKILSDIDFLNVAHCKSHEKGFVKRKCKYNSACGACKAAIEHIENNDALPGSIEGMVDYIRPVVRNVKGTAGDKLVNVTKENARLGAKRLETAGPILPGFINRGELKAVAAYYELSTGKVEFL